MLQVLLFKEVYIVKSAALTATAAELGQSSIIPTTAIPAATVEPWSYPTAAAGCHQATIAASRQ
jgi:hypothetical protein